MHRSAAMMVAVALGVGCAETEAPPPAVPRPSPCPALERTLVDEGLDQVSIHRRVLDCETRDRPKGAIVGDPNVWSRVPEACRSLEYVQEFEECIGRAHISGLDARRAVVAWDDANKKARREQRQAAKERRRAEADAAAKDEADKARAARVSAWMREAVAKCETDVDTNGCAPAHADASPSDVTACQSKCSAIVAHVVDWRFEAAAGDCVQRYVDAGGKGTFSCAVSIPSSAGVPAESIAERTASCTKDCTARGPGELAAAKRRAKEDADAKKAEAAHVLAIRRRQAFADVYDEALLRARMNPDGVEADGPDATNLAVDAWWCSRQAVYEIKNGSVGRQARSVGFKSVSCSNGMYTYSDDL